MSAIGELLRRRRMWRSHARGDTVLPYPPLEVWIEPTNHCNLRCVKCPHSLGLKREKGLMDGALFRRVVDEVSRYAFTVSLHLGGESLIHKELPDFIRYAGAKGLRTVLHSNATLLTEARCRELLDTGLSLISFSIDGEDKETYEATDAGGDFEKTLAGVRLFLETKRALGRTRPLTVVQMLRESDAASFDPETSPLLALGADYLRLAQFHGWSGAFSHAEDAPVPDRPFEATRDDPGEYAPCHNLWYGIAVFWNGTVAPCCLDMEGEYPVGDLEHGTVLDAWNSEAVVALRRALVERRHEEMDLCRDCGYLWGKKPGSALAYARGLLKQALRLRAPALAGVLGGRRWGTHDWNG